MYNKRVRTSKPDNKHTVQLSRKRWESLLYHNWDMLVDELSGSLVALQEKSKAMNVVPKYIYVHYLRTSVYNELQFFRLDLFDERKWNGNTECWEYWDTGIVTGILSTCLPIGENSLLASGCKKETEIEQKRLEYADILHGLMKQMVEGLLQEAVGKSGYDIGHIDIFYGEYMGAVKKIRIG